MLFQTVDRPPLFVYLWYQRSSEKASPGIALYRSRSVTIVAARQPPAAFPHLPAVAVGSNLVVDGSCTDIKLLTHKTFSTCATLHCFQLRRSVLTYLFLSLGIPPKSRSVNHAQLKNFSGVCRRKTVRQNKFHILF